MTSESSDQPRVSICCKPGLYFRDSSCYADDSNPAEKIVLPEIYRSDLTISSMSPEEFLPRYGGTHCLVNAVYNLQSSLTENVFIHLFENGTINVNYSINAEKSFGTDNYCLASQSTDNVTRTVVSVCLKPHHISELRDLKIVAIMASLSIPFFVVIFVIYTILPELRNIHGNIFRCYTAALIFGYATFVETCMDPLCIYAIILIWQFSSLASVFWMNIMAFDIWWTFGGFGSLQRSTDKQDRKKFIIYNCYAWGFPALITGIGIVMDILPAEWTTLIRPGLLENCWFSGVAASEIYNAGPKAATIVSNVLFFAYTAIRIRWQKRNTARHLNDEDSRRHDENVRQRFNPYLKLCIVMGVPRLAQIFVVRYQNIPDYIWYIIDLGDCFQGPIIFVLFVWNENTKQLLLKRLGLKGNTLRQTPDNNFHQSPPDAGVIDTTPTTAMLTLQEDTRDYSGRDEPTISVKIA